MNLSFDDSTLSCIFLNPQLLVASSQQDYVEISFYRQEMHYTKLRLPTAAANSDYVALTGSNTSISSSPDDSSSNILNIMQLL